MAGPFVQGLDGAMPGASNPWNRQLSRTAFSEPGGVRLCVGGVCGRPSKFDCRVAAEPQSSGAEQTGRHERIVGGEPLKDP